MQADATVLKLSGAQKLVDWFGHWPSFHDAEVISIELNREGDSRLAVHYFCTTSRVNMRGQYITEKHVIVSLILDGITELELAGFNQQNVLSSISIVSSVDAYEITLGDCYGVSGRIAATSLRFELQPGIPTKSVYRETLS